MSAKAVLSKELSRGRDKRWVIVEEETGKVLDDANGYGYKSVQNAYAGYNYKSKSPAQKSKAAAAKKAVKDFLRKHPDVEEMYEDCCFQAAKEDREDEINAALVKDILRTLGYTDVPFTPSEFLRYA